MDNKNYTVTEVAEIFQTNPETVRKWIKTDKLLAIKGSSKKEGMRISEEALKNFLTESPKYTKPALTTALAALITGGTAIAGSLIVAGLLSKQKKEADSKSTKVKSTDLIKLLQNEIQQEQDILESKKEELNSLQNEIKKHEDRIDYVKSMISDLSKE